MLSLRDPHAGKLLALIESVLESPGEVRHDVRASIVHRGHAPTDLQGYVDTVARQAYTVTDQMVQEVRDRGYTDDQIFEVTVCSALHAGLVRLDAGLKALEGGS
jgi:alkylhydroperoxidase family enzyme